VIYFIKSHQYVKIGYTDDLWNRLRHISTGCPEPILLWIEEGEKDVEKFYHKMFAAEHFNKEWFHFTDRMKDFIGRRVGNHYRDVSLKDERVREGDLAYCYRGDGSGALGYVDDDYNNGSVVLELVNGYPYGWLEEFKENTLKKVVGYGCQA
jgi:hypothetical protein